MSRSLINMFENKGMSSNPQSVFEKAWELIEALHKHSCIYFEDSTAGTKLDFQLRRRCDAVIEELREARRICDERSNELAGIRGWSHQTTGVELLREILELRIEGCQLIEFCCDLLLENNPLIAKSHMKPLKDEVGVVKLKTYGQKGIIEESVGKLYFPIQVCPEADRYDMSGRRMALVLCILKHRDGAVKDIRRLRNIFIRHGFHYSIEMNPTKMEMFRVINRFRDSFFDGSAGVSCCVVVIMAHGWNGYITASDEEHVKLQDIYDKFGNRQCPVLRQKPKAFIVQACRGEKSKGKASHDASWMSPVDASVRKLPSTSDMLTAYTACPGNLADRHADYGCRLTIEMERVFEQHAGTQHMYELFTEVNRQMVHNELNAEGYEEDRLPHAPMSFDLRRRQPGHTGKAAKKDEKNDPMHIQSNLIKKWYL